MRSTAAARARVYGPFLHRASRVLCGYLPLAFGLVSFALFRIDPSLLKGSPAAWDMRMAEITGNCVLLLGAAFLINKRPLSILLSSIVIATGAIRLISIAAGFDAGIETAYRSGSTPVWADVARLSPMGAMGLIAIGVSYILLKLKSTPGIRVAIEIFSSIVIALGTGPVIQFYLRVASNNSLWFFKHPALQVSVLYMLIGIGLLWRVRERASFDQFPRWLPACTSVVAALIAIYLWQALSHEMESLHATGSISSTGIALPRLILVLGLAIAALLGWLLALTRTSRARELTLEKTNRELQAEIGRREQMEQSLRRSDLRHRESEASFRLLFSNNPQPMWVLNRQTFEFLEVNQAAIEHYGYTGAQFRTMRLQDILATAEPLESTEHRGDALQHSSYRLTLASGAVVEAEVDWYRLMFQGRDSVLWLVTDITDRARVEDKIRQTQKLEGIGRLAGGIAHDFNNLLTIIGGYAHLLAGQLEASPDLQSQATEVVHASDRAASLVTQLLAFSRKQLIEPRLIAVNTLVLNTDKLLRRLIGEEVDLKTSVAPNVWPVRVDPHQLEQVLMNLAINARDAMNGGGRLEIVTANRIVRQDEIGKTLDCAPGDYVQISVSDTGSGMTPEVIAHIFEPFFTTKEMGKGTGLGLAIVYGIVKQSGGEIVVSSVLGSGTRFDVLLPRAQATTEAPLEVTASVAQGTETILLAEDERSVRAITRDMLVRHGYRVLEAASSDEALRICRTFDGRIDLLVTDVVMPGVNGRDLATALMQERPGLKVLFMSGYTDDAITQRGVQSESIEFLSKPFTPEGLNAKVRKILAHNDQEAEPPV